MFDIGGVRKTYPLPKDRPHFNTVRHKKSFQTACAEAKTNLSLSLFLSLSTGSTNKVSARSTDKCRKFSIMENGT